MRFQDVLNETVDSFDKPPMVPRGSYLAQVKSAPVVGAELLADRWETLDFPLRLIQAYDDVDPAALEAFGSLNAAFIRRRFMLDTNEDADGKAAAVRTMADVRRFLSVCGVSEQLPLKQALAESIGTQLIVVIGWTPDKKDPELFRPEIKSIAPVE